MAARGRTTRRAALLWLLAAGPAAAQFDDEAPRGRDLPLPPGVRVERDVAYGPHPRHKLDVYRPAQARRAGIVLMVHGGGWMIGDKGNPGVAPNKVAHWVPRGHIVVAANYRTDRRRPNPLDQADDVAAAIAHVQQQAEAWGGDPQRLVLMGHSAGAHLAALVAADPRIAQKAGAKPWLATVALDSAAYDLVEVMEGRHFGLFDRVFGPRREDWLENSPYHRLRQAPAQPLLLVCSSRRSDACPQAERFGAKVKALGGRATVLPVDLNHSGINAELGRDAGYTAKVEDFLRAAGWP